MMFKSSVFVFLPVAFSLVSGSALPEGSAVKPRATCWTGEIHSPCDGATAGCTVDGIMVTCQGTQMIFADMCGGPNGPWSCTYDDNCNPSCAS
ncbi:hypothetical protein F5Y13DRAFT_3157 [Hypoxylon sp. FL1857]|nr:hypothetical protein F5Y13DRAFT_3157 [Hypoxylon sp. FL1857]